MGKPRPFALSFLNLLAKERGDAAANEAALVDHIKGLFLVKSKYNKDSASAGHIEMSSIGG